MFQQVVQEHNKKLKMEFNKNIVEVSKNETSTSKEEELIKLKSSERSVTNTLNNAVKVEVSQKNTNTILVSHDVRDIINNIGKENISKSLINLYGKNGKLFSSSKAIESVEIPLSEYPIKLEYDLTVTSNDKEVEYKGNQLVNTNPGISYTTLTGKVNSTINTVTPIEAINIIDNDLEKIKNNLDSFSFIYDKSQNKTVPLHEFLNDLSTKIENINKILEDDKTKTKNL